MAPKKKASPMILKKKDIPSFLAKLNNILAVYGPVAKKSQFVFDTITDGAQLRLDYDTTILPPKKYFIPPEEEMVRFSLKPELKIHNPLDKKNAETLWNGKRFLIFGIHSCDLAAIHFHDHILTQVYPDPYRAQRREEGIIIGLNCLTPCKDSFCNSTSTLNNTEPADLMLTELDDSYYVETLTTTGQELIDYCKSLFSPASSHQTKQIKKTLAHRDETFPNPIEEFQKLPKQLEASYEGEM